uniref:Uncharacterized protein n=1 Tax=Geobacillus sp. (strain WCH70) TaxID=471223 RepID=C5DB04_GEOSW
MAACERSDADDIEKSTNEGCLIFVMDLRQFNDLLGERFNFVVWALACPELALDFFAHFAFHIFLVDPVNDYKAFNVFDDDLSDIFEPFFLVFLVRPFVLEQLKDRIRLRRQSLFFNSFELVAHFFDTTKHRYVSRI